MNHVFLLFSIWALFFAGMLVVSSLSAKVKGGTHPVLRKKDDQTCVTKYGHHHEIDASYGPRYVVSQVPEKGYVILNGVKRSIKECKDL